MFVPWRPFPAPESCGEDPRRKFVSVAPPTELRASHPAIYAHAFGDNNNAWTEGVTRDDFHHCVRLTCHTGDNTVAEVYLRQNLLVSYDGESWHNDDVSLDLYQELFGDIQQKEFKAVITAFAEQFQAILSSCAGGGFQVGYKARLARNNLRSYGIQTSACYVRFEFLHPTVIEATVKESSLRNGLRFCTGSTSGGNSRESVRLHHHSVNAAYVDSRYSQTGVPSVCVY